MSGKTIVLLAIVIGIAIMFIVQSICDCIKEIIKSKKKRED